MVDANLAVVAVCAVVLVALFGGAILAGWSARGRVADSDLTLERERLERSEQRAKLAEQRVEVLAHVGREYLARVPAGDGRVDRARLRVLLDETATAAGSAPAPGPAATGADGDGARVA